MLKPTERINQAIIGLEGNRDWEEIKQWILDSFAYESIAEILDDKSPDFQHRIKQGQAKELYQLKNYILKARENLVESRKVNATKEQKRGLESF